MYRAVNNNPTGASVGDCVVRAVSTTLGRSWEDVYIGLFVQGYLLADMPTANRVWGEYLRKQGGECRLIQCPGCTVREFADSHRTGRYILGTGSHVVAVIDGDYFDAWDSGEEIPIYYWKV